MDTFVLPPSPNWHLGNILACNDSGLLAYGSKGELSIVDYKEDGKYTVTFLNLAHKDRLNVVVFSPSNGKFCNCLATCGDDGMVRVWDFKELRLLVCHSGHKDGVRVMGLDWSRADTNRVVSVNDLGSVVCWDLASNTIRRLLCGIKVLPLCLACCPHDKDLVAIGCKRGTTLVIDIKGNGKIIHRLRSSEQDVISISWCPVPYNVFKYKTDQKSSPKVGEDCNLNTKCENRDLLLATGGLDKSIFIWRAGSDGRYEAVLPLPNVCISNTSQRKKGYQGMNANLLWTSVLWVDAYTLLSTSQFAELLAWDLKTSNNKGGKNLQPRLLHSRHHKGCFSIACSIKYDSTLDWKETRKVWTTAMDKHIIAISLATSSLVSDIPTLGGTVFSMAVSPLDPNRLAIGSSDSKIFVWNTSNLYSYNMNSYWKKIVGRVMTISWHPCEEDLLAFGTSDGHVSLLDVASSKLTQLRLYLRHAVYRVHWAPPVVKSDDATKDSKFVLFAVGDGDVLQYSVSTKELNKEPKSLNNAFLNNLDKQLGLTKTIFRSDFAFKPDNTCFAVGHDNGSVYIVSCDALTLQHALYPHKKLINNVEWHPATVACDNNLSPYQNWLATASDNVKVYNIPPESQPTLVATLNGHSEKIVSLAWSPHFQGRLLSASYDCTVQVWDVPKQSCLAICQAHAASVMSALFSPQDPDVVISGSNDGTVRFRPISKCSAPTTKPERKRNLVEIALKSRSEVEEATELTVGMFDISQSEEEATKTTKKKSGKSNASPNTSVSSTSTNQSFEKAGAEDYKKRQKARALFPVTGSSLFTAKHFETLVQRWAGDEDETPHPSVAELGYLDFFGDNKAMQRLLLVEENHQIQIKHFLLAQQSALWRGDTTQMIEEAIVKKQLSDWLISIAPLGGFELWEKACESYAVQLTECGEVTKASSYLLAVHKVHEAVQLLIDHKLYREAVALAKCRLPADDPLICTAYTEWGNTSRLMGQLNLAAHCFLAAGNLQACVETLLRIKELRWLRVATQLARRAGQTEQADSLTLECLHLSVTTGNFPVAYQLLSESPQYQYWSVWLQASESLAKIKNRSEKELFAWLEGRQQGQFNLLFELNKTCTTVGPEYHCLLPHLPNNKAPEFERDMWSYMSGQLAAASAARLEATTQLFLRHAVSAVSSAFHFQTGHPTSLALPLTLTVLAPNGLFAEESILKTECNTTEENQLLKSLRAFACASIILWMNNNWEKVKSLRNNNEPTPEGGDCMKGSGEYKMAWLSDMLEACSADVLDAENITFFVKKAQKQQLQDVVDKEKIQSKCAENKMEKNNSNKNTNSKTVILKTENGKCSEDDKVTNAAVTSSTADGNVAKESKTIAESNADQVPNKNEPLPSVDKKNESLPRGDNKNIPLASVENKNEPYHSDNKNGFDKSLNSSKKDDINAKAPNTASNELTKGSEANNNTSLKCTENVQSAKLGRSGSDVVETDNTLNSNAAPHNGSAAEKTSDEDLTSKLEQLKELENILQKFEATRVSIPNPFTAYLNIKFLLDNVITKQDAKLAEHLHELCDKLWKKSQQ